MTPTDDLQTLKLALNDMARRARQERRYLDIGILEGVIAFMDDRAPPTLALTPAEPEKKRRGRPSKSNGAVDSPASVSDLK